ncbi:MAG: DUF488 domain-containing protein [Devosia sp.]|nr:DUF488 domain-containing protein [Devosiaceae bacterium]
MTTSSRQPGRHRLAIKRVYLPPEETDGQRVLVDRLWPRGLRKADAHVSVWLKEVAPSTELRQWFGHDPARWAEFKSRYAAELAHNPALEKLRDLWAQGDVTLLYSAHDEAHNQARALADFLEASR